MKVSFIGDDCETAIVTRGWFRRRSALITLVSGAAWHYEATNRLCEYDLGVTLTRERKNQIERTQREAEWLPVRVPAARTVLRALPAAKQVVR